MRVLIACIPVPGHLNPQIAIAIALRERGHEVAFYTGSMAARAVEGAGFICHVFGPDVDEPISRSTIPKDGVSDASSAALERNPIRNRARISSVMREWMLDTIPGQVRDIEEIAANWKPDVFLSDSAMLAGVVVLKDTLSFPVVYFSALMGCIIPGPDAPPWGRGLPPPRDFRTRFMSTTADWITSWVTVGFRRRANEIRASFGLPPMKKRVVDEFAHVRLLMINSSPSLDYNRRDLPRSVVYVGACSWDTDHNAEIPDWIQALDRVRPVVHVTEGTIHTRKPLLLQAAAQGLANLPMHVVMSTGRHRKPEELELGTLAPNIQVEQFVSHNQLFPRTDVVVTTGGAGTVTKSLLNGVPVIVVPGSWDLPENAERVVECGAGIRINPDHLTPDRLRAAVTDILAHTRFKENALRVARDLRELGGSGTVVKLLEQFGAQAPRP